LLWLADLNLPAEALDPERVGRCGETEPASSVCSLVGNLIRLHVANEKNGTIWDINDRFSPAHDMGSIARTMAAC